MRKYAYIVALALIAGTVIFTSCRRMEQMMDPIMPDAEMVETPTEMVETPPEMMEMPVDLVDVLIYTNRSFWITLEDAAMAAETTKRLLDAAGVQAEITKNDAYVREWMLHTTGDGNMNVIVLYGVLPASVYGTGNSQPDGSIAENWIETTDGDTILNHADYIAYNTDFDVDKVTEWTPDDALTAVGSNQEGGLQNLMDNPTISLFTAGLSSMMVTSDGAALTPSLANFDSERPIPLNQLQGEWFAEKVFASDTGNAEATYADPVILRDGDLGRLAIVHATTKYEGLLNGEVATQMIINYLLAAPTMMETVETPPEPTPPEVVNIDLTDPNALPNRLTIEGGTLVSARLPETSTAATAPRLQADITEVNASPGGTIFLPFEYSGANALAGCIVCIEGVPGYYDLPYTGAADALPTAIPVGLSINLELGTFEVCYSVYDDQGQYGNFLTAVINVEMEMPETTIDYTDPAMHLYLSFDELDGNQAIDHSQYQNHGMLVGNPQLVEGKFGKALEFNGQTDWVEVPHDESLLVETGLTIMAWIKTPRFTTPGTHWQGIIAKGNNPRSYSFYTQERSLHLSVGFGPQGSASDESLELNQWQHVVAQVDANGTHSYWINGKPAGSIPLKPELPGSSDTETILIGRTHESNREFLGLIDEVRLWRRVLSEEEILQQMGQGLHAE